MQQRLPGGEGLNVAPHRLGIGDPVDVDERPPELCSLLPPAELQLSAVLADRLSNSVGSLFWPGIVRRDRSPVMRHCILLSEATIILYSRGKGKSP